MKKYWQKYITVVNEIEKTVIDVNSDDSDVDISDLFNAFWCLF